MKRTSNKSNKRNKSNNKTDNIKKPTKKIDLKKISNKKRAEYDDMRQIDWYPVDPYCD